MKTSSMANEDNDTKRRRWFVKSACAARKIADILTDDEIEFETGIPATTFKNYRLGISAMPIEAATAIYAKFPTTRSLLYPILCPEGFDIVPRGVVGPKLSSENAAEILMELTSSLGDIADRFGVLRKQIVPRRAFLEQLMGDVISAKEKVDSLMDSTAKAIDSAMFRRGE